MDEINLSEAISGLLNDPKIKDLVQSLQGAADAPSDSDNNSSAPDIGKIIALKNMYEKAMHETDPKINLLTALRPYLSEPRMKNLDVCLKFLRFYKMAGMLKDTDILKELL